MSSSVQSGYLSKYRLLILSLECCILFLQLGYAQLGTGSADQLDTGSIAQLHSISDAQLDSSSVARLDPSLDTQPYSASAAQLDPGSVARLDPGPIAQLDSNSGVLPPLSVCMTLDQEADQVIAKNADSLQLRLLQIEMEQTQLEVNQTDFLHRLIPQVHISASFGVKDILFIDPSNFAPYILPRDAYRLTASLSVSDILDFAKHSKAKLELEKLQTQYRQIKQQYARMRATLQRQLSALDDLLTMLNEELRLKECILHFNEMRFRQGKIDYNQFVNSKLDVLGVKKNIYNLNQQIVSIRSQIPPKGEP